MSKNLTTASTAVVVASTCAATVLVTSTYISADPTPIKPEPFRFRLHPDDERTGP